ncbi:MAG: hypothetical protein ACKVRP_05280 [Bacteroidota bacterium]
MKRIHTVWALLAAGIFLVNGCTSTYPYHALNDDCRCATYTAKAVSGRVTYTVSASYQIGDGITTSIIVEIHNSGKDTLDLSLAYVKIASRNIPYRYNDKFIPMDIPFVLPGGRETLRLEGHVDQTKLADPWLKIAGEELVVTLKGMRVNHRELTTQAIRFVPHNPKLGT